MPCLTLTCQALLSGYPWEGCSKERKDKWLGEMRGREEGLEGVEGGEAVVEMYCTREEQLLLKKR